MFQLHYSCCCDLDDDHDGDDDHDDDDYTACKKITYDIMSLELLYKPTKPVKKTRVTSQDKAKKQIRKEKMLLKYKEKGKRIPRKKVVIKKGPKKKNSMQNMCIGIPTYLFSLAIMHVFFYFFITDSFIHKR